MVIVKFVSVDRDKLVSEALARMIWASTYCQQWTRLREKCC